MTDKMVDDVPRLLLLILFFAALSMPIAGRVFACVFNTYSRHSLYPARFTVGHIDFSLCTHYIYYRAKVNPVIQNIDPADSAAETRPGGLYSQFNGAKRKYPRIKTLLTVGGEEYKVSQQFNGLFTEYYDAYTFAKNALAFLRRHNFDGINLFWTPSTLTPGIKYLSRLIVAFRVVIDEEAINKTKLLLTYQAHARPGFLRLIYDARLMGRFLDYVFIMAYLLAKPESSYTQFKSPLFAPADKNSDQFLLNVNATIHAMHKCGLPFSKMVLGVSGLANIVRLEHPTTQYGPGAPVTTEVLSGEFYFFAGGLAYSEVCTRFNGSELYYDSTQKSPYLVRGSEWVGYENLESLREKVKYVRFMKLAGMMFNNMDEDDFHGKVCKAGKFPLISFIKNNLDKEPPITVATTTTTKKTTTITATTMTSTTTTATTMSATTTKATTMTATTTKATTMTATTTTATTMAATTTRAATTTATKPTATKTTATRTTATTTTATTTTATTRIATTTTATRRTATTRKTTKTTTRTITRYTRKFSTRRIRIFRKRTTRSTKKPTIPIPSRPTYTFPLGETDWNATTTEGYHKRTQTFKPTPDFPYSINVMFYVTMSLLFILGYGLGSLFMGFIRHWNQTRRDSTQVGRLQARRHGL